MKGLDYSLLNKVRSEALEEPKEEQVDELEEAFKVCGRRGLQNPTGALGRRRQASGGESVQLEVRSQHLSRSLRQ